MGRRSLARWSIINNFMSKRNLILLIIVLIVAVAAVFGFLYFNQGTNTAGTDTGGTNFISQFNPFGTSTPKPPVVTPPVDISGYEPGPVEEIPAVKLKKISSMPVAGFGLFSKERYKDVPIVVPTTPPAKPTPPPTEFMTAVRYVDKATGNIYQTFVDKIEERKFSTTTIPKIYEAYLGNKGESVVMRYLKTDDKTIETFVGTLPKEYLGADTTGNNEVKGVFLAEDIKDVSLSPDALKIFYLFNAGDSMVGTTMNLSDKKKVQVFDSPFTEWLSFWPNARMITLTTKPSANVLGYMYAVDPNSKNLNKILGGINGLTTLTSPSGKLVLYSGSNLLLYVYHTDTRNSDTIGVKTLGDKCVWGKASDVVYCAVPRLVEGGAYPDAWYQGETSFSDQLWKIDIKTGNTTMLADPAVIAGGPASLSQGGEDVDGIKLALDEGENYLFFVNKKDSFLWELQLK